MTNKLKKSKIVPHVKRLRYVYTGFAAAVLVGAGWTSVSLITPRLDPTERIAAAKVSLENARKFQTVKINPALSEMPLPEVENPKSRKIIFIAALLPLIIEENARVEAQRAQVKSAQMGSNTYKEMAVSYGLEPNAPRDQLLERIDVIPTSLTLAQSALESGWGTSRFAREGAALFGERTFDMDAPGMRPSQVNEAAQKFLVKSFDHPKLSVRSYMKTLNTNAAYLKLRDHRAALRASGKQASGLDLVPMLHGYSEIGDQYIKRITDTITVNQLNLYDLIKQSTQS